MCLRPYHLSQLRLFGLVIIGTISSLTFYFSWADTDSSGSKIEGSEIKFPVSKKSDSLPHLTLVAEKIYSGGTPIGEDGFKELQKLGVRTIISVDGAKPRASLSRKYGIRYIHIPIGYDGIADEKKAALKSVFTNSKPPYYFHCHHGKHRGPAALAVAMCASEKMTLEQANHYMKLAGTSSHYKGLWKAVADTSSLKDLPPAPPLKEISEVSSMAEVMSEIDVIYDNLKDLKKRDWQPDPTKPDITPAHQSLMLLELLRETPRTTSEDQLKNPKFAKHLKTNTQHASELERILRLGKLKDADQALKRLKSSCTDCHSDFRD